MINYINFDFNYISEVFERNRELNTTIEKLFDKDEKIRKLINTIKRLKNINNDIGSKLNKLKLTMYHKNKSFKSTLIQVISIAQNSQHLSQKLVILNKDINQTLVSSAHNDLNNVDTAKKVLQQLRYLIY